MSCVQEIKAEIQTLGSAERDDLFLWIEKEYAERFDEVLERGLHAGMLDRFIEQAIAEDDAGVTLRACLAERQGHTS